MAGPMTGVSSTQLAPPREQGVQQPDKQGPSKFDAVLADKAHPAQAPQGLEPVRQVEPVLAVETPAAVSKPGNVVSQVVSDLELGQRKLEELIHAGASGKSFSNAELLSLQASMFKYTQELDLTSKVVEKATSGLKDVVKTQV
jgi:hypothetical protein